MKPTIFSLILLFSSVTLQGSTFLDTYAQLQKNPRYRKMSLLEIAIDRSDFEAIRYFEFRATPDQLKHARVLLQNKIATFDAIIKENREEFLTGPEKADLLLKVEESRRSKKDFERLLIEFNTKLESIDKADAARQAAIEKAAQEEAIAKSQAAPAA